MLELPKSLAAAGAGETPKGVKSVEAQASRDRDSMEGMSGMIWQPKKAGSECAVKVFWGSIGAEMYLLAGICWQRPQCPTLVAVCLVGDLLQAWLEKNSFLLQHS